MQRLLAINLLGLFDLYLIITFILGMARRYRQYQGVMGLIFAFGQRWPRLVQLVSQQRTIFLTWRTLAPVGFTFALFFATGLIPLGPVLQEITIGAWITVAGAALTGLRWGLRCGMSVSTMRRDSQGEERGPAASRKGKPQEPNLRGTQT